MRRSAAVQVAIRNYSLWRCGVALWALCGVGVLTLWAVQSEFTRAPQLAALALACVAAGALAYWLSRVRPVTIVWDQTCWRVGPCDAPAGDARQGLLEVHLDLGAWMLLRFVPEGKPRWARALWLPVQRQGAAQDWHVLRCALYAPRPGAVAAVVPDGQPGA